MAVIEFEKPVTGAEGVVAVPVRSPAPMEFLEAVHPGAALLASAAGAEELADDQPPRTDREIIASFEERTRPLDPDQYV